MTAGAPTGQGAPVRWADLPGPAVGTILAADPGHVCLLPVGAVEQHGPHLASGTDSTVAVLLAEEVSRRTGCLVLPAVTFGASFGHGTAFAGTLATAPEELAGHVRRVVEWAAYSGATRFLAVNAHYGNGAALSVAGDHLRLKRPDLRFGVASWWEVDAWVAGEVAADGADWHANRAETSLALALAPHLVDLEAAAGADDPDRTAGLVFRYTATVLSRNGVTGSPSTASATLGHDIERRVVAALVELVERGRTEEPPLGPGETPLSPEGLSPEGMQPRSTAGAGS